MGTIQQLRSGVTRSARPVAADRGWVSRAAGATVAGAALQVLHWWIMEMGPRHYVLHQLSEVWFWKKVLLAPWKRFTSF